MVSWVDKTTTSQANRYAKVGLFCKYSCGHSEILWEEGGCGKGGARIAPTDFSAMIGYMQTTTFTSNKCGSNDRECKEWSQITQVGSRSFPLCLRWVRSRLTEFSSMSHWDSKGLLFQEKRPEAPRTRLLHPVNNLKSLETMTPSYGKAFGRYVKTHEGFLFVVTVFSKQTNRYNKVDRSQQNWAYYVQTYTMCRSTSHSHNPVTVLVKLIASLVHQSQHYAYVHPPTLD